MLHKRLGEGNSMLSPEKRSRKTGSRDNSSNKRDMKAK